MSKKIIDKVWEKYTDNQYQILELGEELIPYIEDRKQQSKIEKLYDDVWASGKYGDKEFNAEQKLHDFIMDFTPKLKNKQLKKKLDDLGFLSFKYMNTIDVLEELK